MKYNWDLLNISSLKKRIKQTLKEDIKVSDITSESIFGARDSQKAYLIAKQNGVIAGMELATLICNCVDEKLKFKPCVKDGTVVKKSVKIASISGKTISILKAERTLLNFVQHLSGIATKTYEFVKLVENTGVKIYDTRKTLPLWRDIQKYAVTVGGGYNHRMGLYDAVMIKDNHITAAGSITNAVNLVKKSKKKYDFLEVETKNLKEVKEAYGIGVDRIMLDNMTLKQMKRSVDWIRKQSLPHPLIEASGGVNLNSVKGIAQTGIDYISVGSLTNSPGILDISMLM